MKKILALLLALISVFALAACGSEASAPAAAPAASEEAGQEAEPVTVRIGLTGAVYEPIWDVVKE